jgi:hypothetical protein
MSIEVSLTVRRLLDFIGYEDEQVQDVFIEYFLKHWGGMGRPELINAITQSEEEYERMFALSMLAQEDSSGVRAVLTSALTSTFSHERWVSALCLGKLKDESVIPTLLVMLVEYLPPHTQYTPQGYYDWQFDAWRIQIAHILGAYKSPQIVNELVATLYLFWQLEQDVQDRGKISQNEGKISQFVVPKSYWKSCQKELMYACGVLDNIASIQNLSVSEGHLYFFIYFAFGKLDLRETYPCILFARLPEQSDVWDQVHQELTHRFDLSQHDWEMYRDSYYGDISRLGL